MTSQLIGRFAMSAVEATREVAGEDRLTRYRASALITFQFNRRDIRRLVMSAAPERRAA